MGFDRLQLGRRRHVTRVPVVSGSASRSPHSCTRRHGITIPSPSPPRVAVRVGNGESRAAARLSTRLNRAAATAYTRWLGTESNRRHADFQSDTGSNGSYREIPPPSVNQHARRRDRTRQHAGFQATPAETPTAVSLTPSRISPRLKAARILLNAARADASINLLGARSSAIHVRRCRALACEAWARAQRPAQPGKAGIATSSR